MQGDLATLAALSTYGMAVPTALTVQSTSGVQAVYPVRGSVIGKSIRCILGEMQVDAVKIGMLYDRPTTQAVMRALRRYSGPVVVDPVLRPTTGVSLAQEPLVDSLLDLVLGRCTVVTPNLAEASALCGHRVRSVEMMIACAQALLQLGPQCVLVKGGHISGQPSDVLVDHLGTLVLAGQRRHTQRSHGTGCALATAIAAYLARGVDVRSACYWAKAHLQHALGQNHGVGAGTHSVAHAAFAEEPIWRRS